MVRLYLKLWLNKDRYVALKGMVWLIIWPYHTEKLQ